MALLPLALVLASCVLHAYWNLLVKRARDKLAFTALYLIVSPTLYLPLFLVLVREHGAIPPAGWACILATGAIYFLYFIALAHAYRGELSVAYPLARGVGPALVLAWGTLFLHEHPTAWGVQGIALILLAVLLLHWRPGRRKRGSGGVGEWGSTDPMEGGMGGRMEEPEPPLCASIHPPPLPHSPTPPLRSSPTLPALLVALMYSGYSLTDKYGVGHLRIHPALYIYLTYTLAALFTVPWVIRRQGVASLREEWRANRVACIAVGTLNLFAYMLVLFAMALPNTPVSYIAPLRTVSVLFGVLFGVRLLQEEGAWTKVAAAILMMAGVALVTWKG